MNKENLMIGIGVAVVVGAVIVAYCALLYWVVGTLLIMVYPMATTAQKIALTILFSFIFSRFKANVTSKQ